MKAFYQNAATLKWELIDGLDNLLQLVPGGYRLKTNAEKTHIWIYEGINVVESGAIADIAKNASGDKYTDWADFDTATKDFFLKAPEIDLVSLTNGTQKTKVIDADGNVLLLATHTDIVNLIAAVNNGGGTQLKAFTVEITRPANVTAYAANDVVADVSAAFLPFLNVAKAIGSGVKIIRIRIQTEDTGVAGKKFNLHLYRDAPTFIADNAAFAVSYANASKRIGAIPVTMGIGNLGTVGMNDYNQAVINPVARDVYFILETVDGFTPSANSTKFQISIDCELSN